MYDRASSGIPQTKQTETQTDESWKQELNNYRQRLNDESRTN